MSFLVMNVSMYMNRRAFEMVQYILNYSPLILLCDHQVNNQHNQLHISKFNTDLNCSQSFFFNFVPTNKSIFYIKRKKSIYLIYVKGTQAECIHLRMYVNIQYTLGYTQSG